MPIDPPPHLAGNDRFNAEVAAFAAAFAPLRAELADRASMSDGGSIFPIDTYELLAVGPLGDAVGDAVVDGATEARILAGGIDDDARLERTVRSSLSTLGEWGPSLRAQVASAAATAEPGLIAAAVAAVMSVDRVASIATDQVLGGWNYGQVIEFGAVDGLWKRWQSMEDTRVRGSHVRANGQTVPADGMFEVGGYMCDGPHDPVLPAKETINCRCYAAPADAPEGATGPSAVSDMTKAQLAAALTRLGGTPDPGASKPALIAAAFALVDDVVLAEASRRTLLRMAAAAGIEGRHLMVTADLRAALAIAAGVTLAASGSPPARSHLGTLSPVVDTLDVSTTAAAAFVDGAGDVGDGSMIALVPTATDADRLAVDGGLPPEDMHVTLAFLGPATDWDADARQACIDAVTGLADDRGALTSNLWATAVFNGGNDDHDTAHVLLVEDDDLPGFHDAAVDIGARTGPMPDQHPVFTPHLTLIYSDDEHDFSDRLGEVTFDRLRVAFGDEITDIALDENAADDEPDEGDEPSDDPEGDDDMATTKGLRTNGDGTATVDVVAQRITVHTNIGDVTVDVPATATPGEGAVAYAKDTGPTSFDVSVTDSAGEAWTIGTVTLADEDGDGIDDDTGERPVDEPMAITTDAAGAWQGMIVPEDVESGDGRKIATGALTHRELPLPLTVSFRNPHGGGDDWASEICGRIDTLERREDGTWWATGVFDLNGDAGREAHRLAAEGFMRGVSVDLDNVIVEYENPEPDPDAPIEEWMDWDPGLFIFTAGRVMGAAFLAHPAFEEAFLELVDPAVVASAGEDVYQPEARLHLPLPAPVDPDTVVASGSPTAAIVETPPAEWFTLPAFDSLMPVRITPEGRISGHVAPFGTCHISFSDRCQPAPTSPSSYGNFRVGQTLTAEGSLVATGPVVIDTVHPDLKLSASDAMAWYAHTGCAVADVAVYEDSHGIVIAGAVRPDITPAQLRSLRGCQPSPDWRAVDGRLDMVALLGVNTSGFIVRAPDEDLSPFALAASGAPSLRARAAFAYATGEPVSMVFDHRPQSRLAAAMSEMRAELAEMRELLRPMRATRARHLASEIAARPRFAVTPSDDDGGEPAVETPDAAEPVATG